MPDAELDPRVALAESALDRIDDRVADDDEATDRQDFIDPTELDGLRVDDGDAPVGGAVDDPHATDPPDIDEEVVEVLDAFVEAFNARDLDGVLDTLADDVEAPGLGGDRANLPAALEDLWEGCPNCVLVRGHLDDEPVGVLWEPNEAAGWWRTAALHVDDARDGRLGVIELTEDPTVLDTVVCEGPDGDAEEGTHWSEWDEGAGT
jgi:hypothetical protein